MIQSDLVFLDIETLPTIDPAIIAAVEADVSPPGSMKKPETIAAWHENEGAEARREAVRKTSLDGGTGRLGALSWAWADGPIVGAHTALDGSHSVDQERKLLSGFFAELECFHAEHRVPPTLVGHNICGFDVRWLWKRSIVLGIRPPHWWPVDARPWDHSRVQDTMILWEGTKGRISQDRLARTLGLGGKGAIDGSKVADAWEEGRHEEIREYCVDDVRTVRRIWCRIVGEDAPVEEDEVVEEASVVQVEVEVPVEVVVSPAPAGEIGFDLAVPEDADDEEIVAAMKGALEKLVEETPVRRVAPAVQRPKVVPAFLREDFPEEELA